MLRELAMSFPYIIGGMLVLAFLLFLVALHQLRVGRRGAYWRLRRTAGQRGGRLLLASVGLFAFGASLGVFGMMTLVAMGRTDIVFSQDSGGLRGVVIPTGMLTTEALTLTATTAVTPTAVATVAPGETSVLPAPASEETPMSQLDVTLAPTFTPPPTLTFTPTLMPSPTPDVYAILQLTPPATTMDDPPRSAALRIVAADDGVTGDGAPLEPQAVFEAGIRRIYFFIRFQGMEDGLQWAPILYRDGEPVQGQMFSWGLGDVGTSFFFLGDEDGYPPGAYETRLYIANHEVSRFEFVVE